VPEPSVDSRSSTRRPAGGAPAVVVGVVAGPHGLRGQLRVRFTGDGPENLMGLAAVRLGTAPDASDAREYEVAKAVPGRPGEVRMSLEGVTRREDAEALRGATVWADPRRLAPLPEGEYYAFELVGCRVEGTDGRDVGTVREVWPTGAADVLVVESDAGGRHLVPAAEDLLRCVDPEARRIVIEVIPGLLEAG